MSEPNGAPTEQSQSFPERPKEEQDGEKGPSKSALKKAAKEKEKVRYIRFVSDFSFITHLHSL